MQVMTPKATRPAPVQTRAAASVLTASCDGYPAGTTGEIIGERQGCMVFVPDSHDRVARWANPRRHLLVPPALLVTLK